MSLATSKLGRFAFGLAASSGMALFFAGSASAASLLPTTPAADVSQVAQSTINTVSDTVSTTSTSSVGSGTGLIAASDTSGGSGSSSAPSAVVKTSLDDKTISVSGADSTVSANDATTPTFAAPITSINPPQPPASPLAAETLTPAVAVVISPAILHQSELTTVTMPQTPVTLGLDDASTPLPSKHPALPKTNGALFSTITDQLAGTVLPRLITVLSGLLHPVLPIGGTLIYIAILLSLVSITYGLFVRRGGFVAAARGDLTAFTFATPALLDYGVTRMPMVLFNGVRDQNMTNLICSNACEERR